MWCGAVEVEGDSFMRAHSLWRLMAVALLVALLAGCGRDGSTDKKGEESSVRVPEAIGQTQATAAAAAATPAQRVEPKGKVVYGWHVSLPPVWLDPLENPALITQ